MMAIQPINTVLGPITKEQKKDYFGQFSEIRQICAQGSASEALNRYRQLPWFKHHDVYDSRIERVISAKMQLASDLINIMKNRDMKTEAQSFLAEIAESPHPHAVAWDSLLAIHDDQWAWFEREVPENEAERKPRAPGWQTLTLHSVASQLVEQRLKEI